MSYWATLGPFGYPQGAQKGPFGLKQTLTERKASERHRNAGFGPTATDWSDWAGTMVTTHLCLVSGLLWATRYPKRARFGPMCSFWRVLKVLGGTPGTRFGPNCHRSV